MSGPRYGESQLFEAFVRSTQYFVRLNTRQDVRDHLAKFITTYLPANWVAFVQMEPENEMSLQYCTLPDAGVARPSLMGEVRALAADVLDSGFLASQVIHLPQASMTVFLPVVVAYKTEQVMLIGHDSADPLPGDLLNIYLAIAGLAGTTLERLNNERELNRHRAHLEELVKERAAELAKTKRQNELILHSVREGICGLDLEGKITFVNPFAAQILGRTPAELIGRNAHATFHHTHPGGCPYPAKQCPVHSAIVDGITKYAADEAFSRKDGTMFPVEFTTAPIVEEGRITGAVIVFRDITERKKAEEDLKDAKSQAELYLDLMGHDISNMHQIALSQLEMAQEIIADEGRLEGSYKEMIDTSIQTLDRSARLIDNVRKLQKLKAGEFKMEEVDVGRILAEVIAEHSNIPDKDVAFTYTPADNCHVMANYLLKDVFANIVGNAIKHSSGPARIAIAVSRIKENGTAFCRVTIDDNGPGIPDASKNVVFDRLKRGDTKARGVGLGLYIVKSLVDSFNGQVRLEDRVPGDHTKGSRFIVLLPASK